MNNIKIKKIFLSAVLAGCWIAFGGTAFLSLENKIAGALFFTVGLFSICTMGLHLFTGKVCYVFQNQRNYALSLPVIWLGNWLGTTLIAVLLRLTRLSDNLIMRAVELCQTKINDSFLSLFILGICCNIFIYLAVEGFLRNPHETGKYLSLFFGVMIFILCSFEHCVADMFYFSLAGLWNINTILRILVITAGNALGGVILPLAREWSKQ